MCYTHSQFPAQSREDTTSGRLGRPCFFTYGNLEKQSGKQKGEFENTFVCKIKVMLELKKHLPELLENMIPWDGRELEKRTKDPQMHPKRTPASFQDQRCNQRYPEKVSRRGPETPEAPQRPKKQFWLSKRLLWGPSGSPPGEAVVARK